MARTKVPLSSIEGGETIRQMLAWFRNLKKASSTDRFDQLWKKARKAAEKAGYGPEDVDRLIAEVRRANGRT